ADVQLELYNILGQRVAVLVSETLQAGYHTVSLDASGLSSGVYLYRITAGSFTQTRKLTLMK
ncbi:MAG: T9SS C-terminal target domain-containing protein, partial [Bacteroidetes bacterium]|nr:T9SS C-terminal target domain-containing protein [Bacteroidota bacterium]